MLWLSLIKSCKAYFQNWLHEMKIDIICSQSFTFLPPPRFVLSEETAYKIFFFFVSIFISDAFW